MQRTFFAPGKVLLCGEYAVLAGLEVLALPVRSGQWLSVWEMPSKGNGKVIWQGNEADGKPWCDVRIDSDIMHVVETNDEETARRLILLLREIKTHKPAFFEHKTIRIETRCEFNRNHGLGSSSTLVACLSAYSGVDVFALQQAGFGGSGYDAAVCSTGKPIAYWLEEGEPNWSPWLLNADFTQNWYLAFPGHKSDSREAISDTREKLNLLRNDALLMQQLNACILAVKNAQSIPMLEAMLELYQALLAQALGLPKAYDDLGIKPIQGGLCKWLGAWGGDVLLVNETIVSKYSETFGAMEVMRWADCVAHQREF
ncbi:MAG: hypothetical protein JNL57_13225 [Bacteroidetes bacterium]|nr:hypothetical protein [Bacteroidota bacterium]